MIALLYLILDYLNNHMIIVYVVGGILLFVLFVKILSSFLRDLDYLRTSLFEYIKAFFLLLYKLLKFLIFKVLFFPFYLIKLIKENRDYNQYIVNSSFFRDPEVIL